MGIISKIKSIFKKKEEPKPAPVTPESKAFVERVLSGEKETPQQAVMRELTKPTTTPAKVYGGGGGYISPTYVPPSFTPAQAREYKKTYGAADYITPSATQQAMERIKVQRVQTKKARQLGGTYFKPSEIGRKEKDAVFVPESQLEGKKVGIGSALLFGLGKVQERVSEVERLEAEVEEEERQIPFTQLALPSQVRRVAEIGGEKIFSVADIPREKITGIPATTEEKRIGGKFLGELALFGAVSPTFTTTAQFERELASRSNVFFKGVQQDIKATTEGTFVKTDIAFDITKAGRKRVGGVTGISEIKALPKEQAIVSKTIFAGRTGQKVFKFPTATQILTKKETFIGESFGIGKQQLGRLYRDVDVAGLKLKVEKPVSLFKEVSFGKLARAKGVKIVKRGRLVRGAEIDRFISKSIGITEKDLSLIVFRGESEVGASAGAGVVKKIKAPPSIFKISGKKTADISALTLKQIQTPITSAVKIPPPKVIIDVKSIVTPSITKQIIKPLTKPAIITKPATIKEAVKQTTKPISLQKDILRQGEINIPKTKISSAIKLSDKTISRQAMAPVSGVREKQQAGQRILLGQRVAEAQKTKIVQRERLKIAQRLKQIEDVVRVGSFRIPFPKLRFKLLPPILPPLPRGKPPLIPKRKKKKGKEDLFIVEGFTEKQLGIKRLIKEKDILKEAMTEGKPLKIRGTPIIIPNVKLKIPKFKPKRLRKKRK